MEKKRGKGEAVQVDSEYVWEICYQFSKLLYDISEEHRNAYIQLEVKCAALEKKCLDYENLLLQNEAVSVQKKTKIITERFTISWKQRIKHFCVRAAKKVFSWGRYLTGRLGIKDRMKQSKLFRKLYLKGTIDKLRE